MTGSPTPINSEELLTRVIEVSVPLHRAIAAFDEAGTRYELADTPGVAMFIRDAPDRISHVSSAPSPGMVPALDDLRVRHLRAAGVTAGVDNSHLLALLLLCTYLVDRDSIERLGLQTVVRRPAQVVALDEEQGRHDPELNPGDVALRAWTPLSAGHDPDAGVHAAVLEMRFAVERYERYAPW